MTGARPGVFSVCMDIFRWVFSLNNSLDSDWEKEILEDEIFGVDLNLAKFKLSFTKNEGEWAHFNNIF